MVFCKNGFSIKVFRSMSILSIPTLFYPQMHNSYMQIPNIFRTSSSRPEVFCEKVTLKNFAKYIEKHLCQSLFFNKILGLRLATLS